MVNILKNNNQKVNYANGDSSSIKKSKPTTFLNELTAKCKEENLHTTGKLGIAKRTQTKKLVNTPLTFKEKFFECSSHLIKKKLTSPCLEGSQANLSVTQQNPWDGWLASLGKANAKVGMAKLAFAKPSLAKLGLASRSASLCQAKLNPEGLALPPKGPKLFYKNLKCKPGKLTCTQPNTTNLIYKRYKDDAPLLHGRPLLGEKTYIFQKIKEISKVSQKQSDYKLFVKNSVKWHETFGLASRSEGFAMPSFAFPTLALSLPSEASQASFATLVSKFTNLLMMDGKKGKAVAIFSKTLILFKRHIENLSCNYKEQGVSVISNKSTFDCLNQAVKNAKPTLEVRNKKIAGITRQIPAVVPRKRQETLAIRWIIKAAKKKKDNYKTFPECLAQELVDVFQKNGQPHQNRNALHKTAEANRFFIRHRWW